jgi:hypothetical protein
MATLRIVWEAPPACPTAEELEARIEALIAPGGERMLVATVDAKVAKEALRWRASLEVTVPQGRTRREVVGKTCEELTNAVALLVAVTLDPTGARAKLWGDKDDPPKPPARATKVRGIVGIAGTGTFAALPRFGGGLLGSAGIDTRYVRAEAVATYEAPQLRLLDSASGAGAVFDLWTVGARGCGVGRVQTLVVPVCAGVEVGRLRARGEGLQAGRRVHLTHARVAVGVGLAWSATHWLEVRADVAGLVTMTPWRVVIEDLGELHRSRPVGVRAGLGFAALFP